MEVSYMANDLVFSRKRPHSIIHENSLVTEPFKKRTCGEEHMHIREWNNTASVLSEANYLTTFEQRIQPNHQTNHDQEMVVDNTSHSQDSEWSQSITHQTPCSQPSYQYLASSWRRRGTSSANCPRCQAGEPGHINHILS